VYISEAHADDEWPISNEIKISQTRTVQERIAVIEKHLKDRKFNVYVDNVTSNNFESVYAGWPERGFVIVNRKIDYISFGKVNDLVRWSEEIDLWLNQNLQS